MRRDRLVLRSQVIGVAVAESQTAAARLVARKTPGLPHE